MWRSDSLKLRLESGVIVENGKVGAASRRAQMDTENASKRLLNINRQMGKWKWRKYAVNGGGERFG